MSSKKKTNAAGTATATARQAFEGKAGIEAAARAGRRGIFRRTGCGIYPRRP